MLHVVPEQLAVTSAGAAQKIFDSTVKLSLAHSARLVKLPVVRLALTGATTPIELTYLDSTQTRVPCQAAAVHKNTQDTPQATPHHTDVSVTDKSTESFQLLRGETLMVPWLTGRVRKQFV